MIGRELGRVDLASLGRVVDGGRDAVGQFRERRIIAHIDADDEVSTARGEHRGHEITLAAVPRHQRKRGRERRRRIGLRQRANQSGTSKRAQRRARPIGRELEQRRGAQQVVTPRFGQHPNIPFRWYCVLRR